MNEGILKRAAALGPEKSPDTTEIESQRKVAIQELASQFNMSAEDLRSISHTFAESEGRTYRASVNGVAVEVNSKLVDDEDYLHTGNLDGVPLNKHDASAIWEKLFEASSAIEELDKRFVSETIEYIESNVGAVESAEYQASLGDRLERVLGKI